MRVLSRIGALVASCNSRRSNAWQTLPGITVPACPRDFSEDSAPSRKLSVQELYSNRPHPLHNSFDAAFLNALTVKDQEVAVNGLKGSVWKELRPKEHRAGADATYGAVLAVNRSLAEIVPKRLLTRPYVWAIQRYIEEDFDEQEFEDGCTHAIQTVLNLYGAQDYYALKTMVSDSLLEAMRNGHEQLAQEGLVISAMTADVRSVHMIGASLWELEQLQELTNISRHSMTPDSSSTWLVCTVRVAADVHTALVDKTGEFAGHYDTTKQGRWLLARGPLPRSGLVKELTSPWKVLAWSE